MVFHIRNTNALKHHLKQGGHLSGQEIFVLLAETRQRLEEFISLADLLEDNRLVLVVPDNAPETLSRAQLLFPRFFTSVSERYDDLCSVVKQMIQKNSHQY